MTNLERFNSLYCQYNYVFHGIQLNKVICIELWLFANHKIMTGPKTFLKNLFCVKDVNRMRTDCEILTTCCSGRKDYVELYEQVCGKIWDKTIPNHPYLWRDKLCFHPFLLFKTYLKSFLLLKGSQLSFLEKIALTSCLYYYCNTLLDLEKCDLTMVKKYVCEIDVNRFENLLVQYVRKQGIPTFTLEEGLFYIYRGIVPVDSVHYNVLTADKLLCWSQYVVDEYKSFGIAESRLALAGYPKNVNQRKMKRCNEMNNCVLLLARKDFDDVNFKLLSFLKQINQKYSFSLKLHPSCNFEKYFQYAKSNGMEIIGKEKSLNDCLNQDEYDWAIAVNTTSYYEALMRGIPCLRFSDESFQLPLGWEDTFSSQTELESALNRIEEKGTDGYQAEIDQMLKYTMGLGIDNYREILLS